MILRSTRLVVRYSVFALIAILSNICAQDFIVYAYSGYLNILVSVVVGTGVGLLVKYHLDKHFIFRFQPRGAVQDLQVFILYMAMGLLTTVVFWGFEYWFHQVFGTKEMRYIGGVIGLSVGYLIKYHLDKRFVFREAAR